MVFGNKGDRSGTGVVFTRNPSTGEKEIYGEYLANAQGEDVVAGIRTPQPVEALGREMPEAYDQLLDTLHRLEENYRDMQDTEFTVEDGVLYMLQTRAGEAHGRRGAQGRGRHGRRGADHAGGGGAADRPEPARPAAAPADRPRPRRPSPSRRA